MDRSPPSGPGRVAPPRVALCALALMFGLFADGAAALAQVAGGGTRTGVPRPLAPVSPDPLQPRAPKPAAPLMASPSPNRPSVYPVGPTAEQESVRQRSRPEFEPVGIELDRLLSTTGMVARDAARDHNSGLSSFIVFPRLDLEVRTESNLFRDASSVSDTIFVTKPSLTVRSDWASHALEVSTGGEIGRHANTGSEDYEDVFVRIAGKAEWRDDIETRASARVARTHQKRGTLADPGDTSGVIEIDTVEVAIGATWDTGALKLAVDFRVEDQDYISTKGRDSDDLDRTDRELRFRVSREFDEGTSVFVQPRLYTRRYRRRRDGGGLLQDNEGAEVLAGLSWDASGVTFAEFGVGYLRQTFDEPTLSTISGPSFNGRAVWNATDLMTFTLNLTRTIDETSSPGFSGVVVTSFKSRVDYEFLYSTIVSLRFDYTLEDFDRNPRSDDRIETALEVRHLLNEYLFTGFELGYERLGSNIAGESYRNVQAAIRLGAQI